MHAIAVSCLETSLGFLNIVSNFISNTYQDLEVSGTCKLHHSSRHLCVISSNYFGKRQSRQATGQD
eukprot:15361981-Ditylum_brightwellii.AAC.1